MENATTLKTVRANTKELIANPTAKTVQEYLDTTYNPFLAAKGVELTAALNTEASKAVKIFREFYVVGEKDTLKVSPIIISKIKLLEVSVDMGIVSADANEAYDLIANGDIWGRPVEDLLTAYEELVMSDGTFVIGDELVPLHGGDCELFGIFQTDAIAEVSEADVARILRTDIRYCEGVEYFVKQDTDYLLSIDRPLGNLKNFGGRFYMINGTWYQ